MLSTAQGTVAAAAMSAGSPLTPPAVSFERKRRAAVQLTLESAVAELPHVLKDFAHPKRNADNNTPEHPSLGEGMDSAP